MFLLYNAKKKGTTVFFVNEAVALKYTDISEAWLLSIVAFQNISSELDGNLGI